MFEELLESDILFYFLSKTTSEVVTSNKVNF